MKHIILIQPRDGIYNKFLKPWLPLSLLAAAVYPARDGYKITVIDQRVNPHWRRDLEESLSLSPVCVGITSMTGSQIRGALEASRFVKKKSGIPVIWGGVHATLFPEQTLQHELIDFLVRGEGEKTFYELIKQIETGGGYENILGLCYKKNGCIIQNPDRPFMNPDDLPEMPYHLINIVDYEHRYFNEKNVVEIESSRGCPYNCSFCYNPLYNKRQWRALSPEKVVSLVKQLNSRFSFRCFQFIDDCFFIDKQRVRDILAGILETGLDLVLGFQGVRIDTFTQLSDNDLDLLAKAGCKFLQFGVESGSPRILELINKKINVEDVIELNKRLSQYANFIPHYNFMCGFPTETKEDLLQTTALAWRLLKDNPYCTISPFHHYKPYPGTALRELVIDKNHATPGTLEEWGEFDWTRFIEIGHDPEMMDLMKKVEVVSILVDRKIEFQMDSFFWNFVSKFYRPIARFRLKHNIYSFMPEYYLKEVFTKG